MSVYVGKRERRRAAADFARSTKKTKIPTLLYHLII
jgi:hypothetical protein